MRRTRWQHLGFAFLIGVLPCSAGADDSSSRLTRQEQMLAEGHRLSDAGRYCEAFQLYDRVATEQGTPSAAILFAAGRAAHKGGIWDQAISALERFVPASGDAGAQELAQKWLRDAEAGVTRCRIELDGSTPSEVAFDVTEALPPADTPHSCGHGRLVRIDDGNTALLNVGWRYRLRGSAQGTPIQPVDVRVMQHLSASGVQNANSVTSALELPRHACVLKLARSSAAPATQPSDTRGQPGPAARSAPIDVAPSIEAGPALAHGPAAIPTLSYIAWGGAALAAVGTTLALIERSVEIDRWNSRECLRDGMTREQTCSEHREAYQSAGTLALATGAAAGGLAATGFLLWWLVPDDGAPDAAMVCTPGLGLSATCTARF